ncbi:MAG: NigD-like C-terminal domain-containing protein [Muribaculaceae bacterium]|nr:NigD-like C-terminal domain-containing protein [Muribaculaceae bacterium]
MSRVILILFALASLASCTENIGGIDEDTRFDMVTFEQENAEGTLFSMQSYEDSPLMSLQADGLKGLELKRGERTMLYYYPENTVSENYKKIKVEYKVTTLFDSLRVLNSNNISNLNSDLIRLKSIWRTGNFLNFNMYLQYTGKPRQLMLIMDKSTRYNEVVDFYLVDNMLGVEGTFYRRAYASFFVGRVWEQSSCRKIRVYVNDESYPTIKYYEFSKQ